MLSFTLAISCLTTSNLLWFMGVNFRFLCNIALYSSDLASITSHIHSRILFLLWLHPFIFSGVISSLISSSILGTYRPGEFLSLSYHFAFSYCSWGSEGKNTEVACPPFSSGPHFVRPLHHDPPVLGCSTGMAWFHWVRQGCGPSVIRLTSFLWVWFQCVCPLMLSYNTYHLTWVSLTLGVGYLFTAAPAKHSCCSLPWTRGISLPPLFLTFNVG